MASAEANTLLKIKDEIEDDIETLALAACIFAEAHDNPDFAQRRLEMTHVGGVILNRVNNKYRSLTTVLDTVLLPDAFFKQDGTNARTALLSKDPAQIKAWRQALKGDDAIRYDESLDIARDLVDDPASNPFAAMPGGDRVNHYYSPKVWKTVRPEWTNLALGTCDRDAGEVAITSINHDRFRWYKGVH